MTRIWEIFRGEKNYSVSFGAVAFVKEIPILTVFPSIHFLGFSWLRRRFRGDDEFLVRNSWQLAGFRCENFPFFSGTFLTLTCGWSYFVILALLACVEKSWNHLKLNGEFLRVIVKATWILQWTKNQQKNRKDWKWFHIHSSKDDHQNIVRSVNGLHDVFALAE